MTETFKQAGLDTGKRIGIRWVTWWPIGYWFPRFDELAQRPDVDLEVVFLSGSSEHYEDFPLDEVQFRYNILSSASSKSAFYRPTFAFHNPFELAAGNKKLIINYADLSSAAASLIRRARRQPYYLFVANSFKDNRPSSYISDAAKRFIFPGSAGCLATGPLQVDYARHYAGPKKPITVIGNPADSKYHREQARQLLPIRQELRERRAWSDRFVIGYVGRLAPEKELHLVISAARQLIDQGVLALIALGGTGPERGALEALAREQNVPVEFAGFIRGQELCEFYASLDAFVLPSSSEPWGLVVNEAMEFRLPPIVSSNVGAQHLIQHGRNGFVCPVGDVSALTGCLLEIATDQMLRDALGRAAQKRIQTETAANWADAVLSGLLRK